MAKKSAYEVLVEATGIEPEAGEDTQKFLERMVYGVQDLEKTEWDKLPKSAQDWFNESAERMQQNEEAALDMIPGMPIGDEVAGVETVSEEAADTAKEVKAKKEKAPKKEKEPKEPKAPPAADAVRRILADDMSLNLKQVMARLEEMGVDMKQSSAQVVYLNTVRAYEVAIREGEVKKEGKPVLQKVS